jgi:arylsulfatase A-like enzyme
LAFIESNRENPYFLYLTYNAPHTPLQVPEEEIIPFRKMGGLNEAVCRIYAMIKRMDKGIGKILEKIDDNTIVLFTSDNGPCFRGEGEENRLRYNMDFSGNKGDVLEGGIRVPGIIKLPGNNEGFDHESPVHFIDWLPTLYEMAGGKAEDLKGIDGESIKEITGKSERAQGKPLFWQWNRLTPVAQCNMAMRQNGFKLYYPPVPEAVMYLHSETEPFLEIMNGLDKRHELNRNDVVRQLSRPLKPKLFNIIDDPEEKEDISSDNEKVYNNMKSDLDEWFDQMEKEWQKAADSTIGDSVGIYKREY